MLLEKGITVLICTHNGANNLPETLKHLANQILDDDIPKEIILIDNASTDNSIEIAIKVWNELECKIPLIPEIEPRLGKENAIDKGLEMANFQFVIICDDDNWLEKNYLQTVYEIMQKNKNIGMLGGQGIPSENLKLPEWFTKVKSNYAIGQQNIISGEVKSSWPNSRFIWGAGSVINMDAYYLLQKCGFKRALTCESVGKTARAEDLELSSAIRLTGYKLWYDERLIYVHAILQKRLTWDSLIYMSKISIPAYHILKPYNILLHTGKENAPLYSHWAQHILIYFKNLFQYFSFPKDIITIFRIIFKIDKHSLQYLRQIRSVYIFIGALRLGKKYDHNFKTIKQLQIRLCEAVDDYDQKLLNQ